MAARFLIYAILSSAIFISPKSDIRALVSLLIIATCHLSRKLSVIEVNTTLTSRRSERLIANKPLKGSDIDHEETAARFLSADLVMNGATIVCSAWGIWSSWLMKH